ncbi:MAG: SRPBCC domain-containing protein [Candidatus Velthaea sp.]
MHDTTTRSVPRLVIRRTLPAPRSRVFAAWTQPEQMRRWAGPDDVTVPEVESDFRVGGAYRITMRKPDGEVLAVRGIFREIREPERLAYTWSWEEDRPEDEIETLITVEFNERGQETELILTQEQFATVASRDNHQHGWNGALDNLATYLQS